MADKKFKDYFNEKTEVNDLPTDAKVLIQDGSNEPQKIDPKNIGYYVIKTKYADLTALESAHPVADQTEHTRAYNSDNSGAFWEVVNGVWVFKKMVYKFVDVNTFGSLAGKFNIKPDNIYAIINPDLHTCWIGYGGHEAFPNIIGSEDGTGANYSGVMGYDNIADAIASVLWSFHSLCHKDSDHPTILGGSYNKILSGSYNSIIGGTENEILAGDNCSIGGGLRNTINAIGASDVGVAILSGYENINNGNKCVIVGGYSNLIGSTGNESVIGGGFDNELVGSRNVIAGGNNNRITASTCNNAVITGGESNETDQDHSRLGGKQARGYYGADVWSNAGFSNEIGSSQKMDFVANLTTTNGTESNQGINGVKPVIEDNSIWYMKTYCIASDGTDNAVFEFNSVIVKGTGNASLSNSGEVVNVIHATSGASTWSHRVTISTNGAINIKATGEAGKTIRWTTRCEVTMQKNS